MNTITSDFIEIVLPYASFDLQVLDTYPNITNSTRYFPLRRVAKDTQYTLGRTFLQETYVILVKRQQCFTEPLRTSLILVCRYLIADYKRSTFSVNQCRFVENNDPDIRPIFPATARYLTTGAPPFDPDRKHDLSDRSPGIIAAIAVGLSVFLAILVSILTLLRRRRSKGKTPNSDHLD